MKTSTGNGDALGAASQHGDLEWEASRYAARDASEAEKAIAVLAEAAIRRWQLDEARFWQRVKFRARLLRAARAQPEGGWRC